MNFLHPPEPSPYMTDCKAYDRLQGLKRQKKHLEDKQGLFHHDRDRDEVIGALGEEIKRVRKALQEAKKDGEKQK